MVFAYMRVSTTDKQDFDRQVYVLNNSGYEISERNIFCDKATGKNTDRDQYQLLKKIVRQGDTVVFTELARFSRNYKEISSEMLYFQDAKVKLIFLDMPFLNTDSDDLTQQLINDVCIKLFAYVAQIERENTSKRIKQKLDSMRESGVKLGRPELLLNETQIDILNQYINKYPEQLTAQEAAKRMKININSFYKQLRIHRKKIPQK